MGVSIKIMETPLLELVANHDFQLDQVSLAIEFLDELQLLGVLQLVKEKGVTLEKNVLVFLVPKPNQPGECRVIADGKG